jgi:hypothetical protein
MKNINVQLDSLDFTKPVSFYAKFYGLSENAIRNRFKKMGIYKKFLFTQGNTSTLRSGVLRAQYDHSPKVCLQCKVIIPYDARYNDYCSHKCSAIHTQKYGGNCCWSDVDKKRISEWAKKYAYKKPRERIKKICLCCHSEFEVTKAAVKKFCSRECSGKWIRETGYMKGKTGGYRKEAGRGKMGWYKGYYCNSTWELAWVIYQLDRGMRFKRNTEGFEYEFNKKRLKFYPDFILENGEYVEIKGWITDKDKAKFSAFPKTLNILYRKDMTPILNSVVSKYGKEYWKLYGRRLLVTANHAIRKRTK